MSDDNYQRGFNDNMLEWRGEVRATLTTFGNEIKALRDSTGVKMWFKIISLISGIVGLAFLIAQYLPLGTP